MINAVEARKIAEAHKTIIGYIKANPGVPYYKIAKAVGYTQQYVGRLAKEAGLPSRRGGRQLSRITQIQRWGVWL